MTKDDLIRMADLAGYDVDDDDDVYAPAQGRYGLDPRLQKFAKLVAAAEREVCAKLCEGFPMPNGILGAHPEYLEGKRMAISQCAAAIRGRTE